MVYSDFFVLEWIGKKITVGKISSLLSLFPTTLKAIPPKNYYIAACTTSIF